MATTEHTHQADEAIPAETSEDSAASDYWSDGASDTTSLRSSIFQFEHENGRRYHRVDANKHMLPNDEREQDRLDLYHHALYLLLDRKLTLAPLNNPHRILDIATGTGIWVIDIADQYPEAEVIGTDITPIQPPLVPPNARFEIDDAESDWTFTENCFDLIHSRMLAHSIKDWPKYFKQMFRHARPGGYIELVEARFQMYSDDNSIPEDSAVAEYFRRFNDAGAKIGIPLPHGKDYVRMLGEAGFVDISWYEKKQPWSPWPKDKDRKHLGLVSLAVAQEGVPGYGMAMFTRVLGWEAGKAKKLCDDTLGDLRNKRIHEYMMIDVILARKPEQ